MLKKNQKNTWMIEEIKAAQQNGIGVSVDGILCSFCKEEDLSMVLESDGDYMSDYTGDACGKIVHINYDRIKSDESNRKKNYKKR